MTSAHTRRRLGAGLSCLVLTVGLAACGGGGGGGGSKKDYSKAIDAFCKTVETGANQVQTDVTKAQAGNTSDPKAVFKSIGTALDNFANAIDGGLTTFKKADVPGDFKSFNSQAVQGIGELVSKLHDAAKAASSGNAAALQKFSSTLGDVKLPKLPSDLAKDAPSCQRISS